MTEDQRPGAGAGCRFTIRQLLVVVAVISLTCAILLPALHTARVRSWLTDCKNNPFYLQVLMQTYVSRYGNDVDYPTNVPPVGGVGGGVPSGTNGAFWSHLWRLPAGASTTPGGANSLAVCKRPGDDISFRCIVHGPRAATSTCLDYSGPNLSDLQSYPGGKLSDRTPADTFIAGDLLLPGDGNHDGLPPDLQDVNTVRFDGSAHTIPAGPEHARELARYLQQTDAGSTAVRSK